MKPIKYINGHVVIEDMPAGLLHVGKSERDGKAAVRVSLKSVDKRIIDGDACIYVDRGCLVHKSGQNLDGVFDIILVDDKHTVYADIIHPETKELMRISSNPPLSSENIRTMAENAKASYTGHQRRGFNRKKHVIKNIDEKDHVVDEIGYILREDHVRSIGDPAGFIDFK